MDGDGVFERTQVGVSGRFVVDVDGWFAHDAVIVTKTLAAERKRLAGIAVALSLDAELVGIVAGKRRHGDCS